MNRTYKIALGMFLFLVISITWLESTEPEPINWTPSYTNLDRIPLGARIFFESWKETNPEIREIEIPPYEFLDSDAPEGTYFFLNDRVGFDDNELDRLLSWVSAGNRLFISSYGFGENLEDTLNLELSSYIDAKAFTSRPKMNLVNPDLELEKSIEFDQDLPSVYFSKIDTSSQVALGTSQFDLEDPQKYLNFIKTDFGEGEIYLHSVPQAFSNYFLLKDKNYRYPEALLAYLHAEPILWDAYYKSGKSFFTSPLYILLNNRSLKWAYYFMILAAILFILFEGKRKQRAIPEISPAKNKSVEFTKTISSLYLEQKRFHELGLKKIALFEEFIRNQYRMETGNPNSDFQRNLAAKSGNSLEETKRLFDRIRTFQQSKNNSKQEFFELSKCINSFKASNGKQ
ncbi:DUF4350 domain-containing protein [Gramella sp. GC03-9]|uniref:DUF4350 domain-containing protein n=1 Tax=Christiangramia oceanisediminis TaxID=2920386 RepID=A0A9X2I602_9FLAO|nr:DUF4350 domain-containing protein [Gramella oceanisediminis]MCP9200042.1 DUF4350 domain-containing protein [Gramella oceanisediminis]